MLKRGHRNCVLCTFFAKQHKGSSLPISSELEMVRIVEYGDIPGVNTPDLVIQLKRTFPAIEVCFGQFICSSHLRSHEKG